MDFLMWVTNLEGQLKMLLHDIKSSFKVFPLVLFLQMTYPNMNHLFLN